MCLFLVPVVSSREALHETRLRSLVLGPMIDELEALTECGAVVKDLVASFLLPEVERRFLQQRGASLNSCLRVTQQFYDSID